MLASFARILSRSDDQLIPLARKAPSIFSPACPKQLGMSTVHVLPHTPWLHPVTPLGLCSDDLTTHPSVPARCWHFRLAIRAFYSTVALLFQYFDNKNLTLATLAPHGEA